MALSAPSLFLYGLEITAENQYLTFENSSGQLTAVITIGKYSLTGILNAIISAIQAQDPVATYSYSVDRDILGGTQNRITIESTDAVFSLLFLTGNPSNPAAQIGFNSVDYTGDQSYTGSATAGIALIPNQLAYTFLPVQNKRKNFGARNISASGLKETITFSIQSFWQAMFKYIPKNIYDSEWAPIVLWMIQQNEFEFTPMITDPGIFYVGTLDDPNQGMALDFVEMLPDFPNEYQSPLMIFRMRNTT